MTGIDLTISRELSIPADRVAAVRSLFSEGATVPFVARYRKERTGGLDEVQLRQIIERDTELTDLEKRRGSILEMLKDQKLLTPELEQKIRSARDRNVLEDIYAPFRKRKETRADKARAAGLGPLADALFKGTDTSVVELVNTLKPASLSHEDARKGAMDILAEQAAHDVDLRQKLRRLFERQGALESKRKNRTADETYRQYFEWREPAGRTPSHRVLAMLRGAAEGALTVTLRPPEVAAIRLVLDYFVGDADSRRSVQEPGQERRQERRQERGDTQRQELFSEVATDSWKRLLLPSLEREALTAVRDRAVQEAVKVFQRNLEALLLAPPLGSLRVMALDPGVRTGCKVACIGPAGEFLESAQVYPLPPRSDEEGAARVLKGLCETHEIEAVAVGNGTGGRETEAFFRDRVLQPGMLLVSVDEAGASVYSASDIAREEFPDMDIHFRGAVSIGRRLQDPLAELVKIDPASIGVGQYQHDIPSGRLRDALGATVESCVNRVGVDINTAGVPLLSRVAGLSPRQAREIVLYREKHGLFRRRLDIGKAPGVGAKTVEQAVGFLRCPVSPEPLENTGVHAERYPLVARMAKDLGTTVQELVGNEEVLKRLKLEDYLDDAWGVGLPTVQDIVNELRYPGRDPRADFRAPAFRPDVTTFEDLTEGMELEGVVRNVTAFGAFVDVGVHQDGLVHVSELSDRYVTDPGTVAAPGQLVSVRVIGIDKERRRISLSMKSH